jgi:hypothetical protein
MGWIHGSNNEDLSKRLCLFFANKTLPQADTCWPKWSKPELAQKIGNSLLIPKTYISIGVNV